MGTKAFPFFLNQIYFARLLYSYRDDLLKNVGKTTSKECKTTLPVDVRHSKMSLSDVLKLPIIAGLGTGFSCIYVLDCAQATLGHG